MLSTRFTERFQLDHPIVCAPMALITGGTLAGAVSAAGGLGILGGGYAGGLGAEPDLMAQYDLAGNNRIGAGVITWAAMRNPQVVDGLLERQPACLFLSFGDPAELAAKARAADIPVFCQVQTMAHVDEALAAGAEVIVAQGGEAGGHGGARATMAFVPEVADYLAVRSPGTLLLAAGGIGDGRGLAASLMLGADGVLVGSRFWASREALTPDAMVARAIKATGDDTMRTTALDALRGVDWPDEFSFRVLRNQLTDQWAGRQADAKAAFASLKGAYDKARAENNLDMVATIVGEVTGLIKDRPPARDIVESMSTEAKALLAKWR